MVENKKNELSSRVKKFSKVQKYSPLNAIW